MAQKRMFDKRVIDNDEFLEMPLTTQAVYFHFNMRADDDGFVDNYKSILRLIGGKEDDLKVLVLKKFIIPFEKGVIVIKHWKINNLLRKDRYTATIHQEEKEKLITEKNGEYSLGIPMVDQMATQYSKVEYSIVENNNSSNNNAYARETNIYEFIEKVFGRTFSDFEYERISQWGDSELIRYAIEISKIQGITNLGYVEGILRNFRENNISTLEQAKKYEEEYKKNKSKKQSEKENLEEKKEWTFYEYDGLKYKTNGKENIVIGEVK